MGTSFQAIVFCRECKRSIGDVDEGELIHLLAENPKGPICFDCQPYEADKLPLVFDLLVDGDILWIEESFEYKKSLMGKLKLFPIARAHVSARARGLSSVTYLNGFSKESVVLEFIERGAHCLTCDGFGEYWYLDKQVECSACLGIGRIGDKVLLPLWLVNGVRENA